MSAVLARTLSDIETVAVIDDDRDQAELTALLLEEAEFKPLFITAKKPFRYPGEVAELVRGQAQGAVCDHRLTHHGFSTFNGAELSALLHDSRIPNILTTQYIDMDVDVSIRKWRHKIPALLSRDATDSESIRLGLTQSLREILGEVSETRKPYKSLIRVTDLIGEAETSVLDVIIPSWNPLRAVRFPLSLIPGDLQLSVQAGTRLFSFVNIGAEDPQELYFNGFELAPEPDPTNGLT